MQRTQAQWDELEGLAKTDTEKQVIALARDGRPLNDLGYTEFRRVEARTQEHRARLSAYNRVYAAKRRRVKSGEWPPQVPTPSECVERGLLEEGEQYNTADYIRAVERWIQAQAAALPTFYPEQYTSEGQGRRPAYYPVEVVNDRPAQVQTFTSAPASHDGVQVEIINRPSQQSANQDSRATIEQVIELLQSLID